MSSFFASSSSNRSNPDAENSNDRKQPYRVPGRPLQVAAPYSSYFLSLLFQPNTEHVKRGASFFAHSQQEAPDHAHHNQSSSPLLGLSANTRSVISLPSSSSSSVGNAFQAGLLATTTTTAEKAYGAAGSNGAIYPPRSAVVPPHVSTQTGGSHINLTESLDTQSKVFAFHQALRLAEERRRGLDQEHLIRSFLQSRRQGAQQETASLSSSLNDQSILASVARSISSYQRKEQSDLNPSGLGEAAAVPSSKHVERSQGSPQSYDKKRNKTRPNERFPVTLYRMLNEVGKTSRGSDILCFTPSGTGFYIHNREVFEQVVLPRFFHHGKLASFRRQLNLYGFRLVSQGEDAGAYVHEVFHRDNRRASEMIQRK